METPDKNINSNPQFKNKDLEEKKFPNPNDGNWDQRENQREMGSQKDPINEDYASENEGINPENKNSEFIDQQRSQEEQDDFDSEMMDNLRGNDSLGNAEKNLKEIKDKDFDEKIKDQQENKDKNWSGQDSGRDGQWTEEKPYLE